MSVDSLDGASVGIGDVGNAGGSSSTEGVLELKSITADRTLSLRVSGTALGDGGSFTSKFHFVTGVRITVTEIKQQQRNLKSSHYGVHIEGVTLSTIQIFHDEFKPTNYGWSPN